MDLGASFLNEDGVAAGMSLMQTSVLRMHRHEGTHSGTATEPGRLYKSIRWRCSWIEKASADAGRQTDLLLVWEDGRWICFSPSMSSSDSSRFGVRHLVQRSAQADVSQRRLLRLGRAASEAHKAEEQ